ncbi:unnamed protein product [Prunus armeniaca]|uniref:Adenylate kinase isoenzyme 6 homolog n=1 Tax=Prunus armeniaca TaxID=36596 RepID=A0A6J5Y575_PRUAR|nr:unnamed protein product [Prunus armeniaca]
MSPPEQILGDQGRLLPGLGSWNPFIQKNPLRTQYLPFPSPSCALNWSSAVGGQVLFCSSDIVYQRAMVRKRPNILVTGTPGTGKTTTSSALTEATQLHHINVGDLVKAKNLHDGWDDELDCYIINEDLVCDELEDTMEEGGNIVDYHGCDFFPERWFDLVVVLQTDNTVLYDRLTRRGYSESKLSNNIECEIFQTLLEEAKESYPEDIVLPLKSDSIQDVSTNRSTLVEWVRRWQPST